MRLAALTLAVMVGGCQQPTDCKFHHREGEHALPRVYVPARDVYQCQDGRFIYLPIKQGAQNVRNH